MATIASMSGSLEGETMKKEKKEQLWKISHAKSFKHGNRSTIYWVGQKKIGEDNLPTGERMHGASYHGEWKGDAKTGYGIQTYPNGNKYEGQWESGKRAGEGVLWIRVGKTGNKLRKLFVGGWKDDKRHGKGTCFFRNGEYFQGDWELGKMHGTGQMRYANGDMYIGSWNDGDRSGYGTLNKANGDSYEGYWLKDKREGSGSYFYAETGKVFVGEWVNDLPKAGVYSQAQTNPEQAVAVPQTSKLPPVRLTGPAEVLEGALSMVRQERTAYRAKHTPIESLFTAEELADLKDAFNAAQQADGTIQMLDLQGLYQSLGITISPPELTVLCQSIDIEAETAALSFTDFARTIALILDQEVAEPGEEDIPEDYIGQDEGDQFYDDGL